MDPLTFHTKFSVEDFDSQYNLRSKRPDYESTVIPEWIERSGKVRSDFSDMLDIRYGAGQKQQLDLFRVSKKFLIFSFDPNGKFISIIAYSLSGGFGSLANVGVGDRFLDQFSISISLSFLTVCIMSFIIVI